MTDLDQLFYPRNIAVIGATPKRKWTWSSGNSWISGSFKLGFQGAIYPIHPTAQNILGLRAYKSILDIPGEIDLAVFTVPLRAVRSIMEDCVKKGVKFVHILTAGFSETGIKEYADLELELARIARKGGIRVVGPNCMGLYCPEGGISWTDQFPTEPGSIGIFSQSGQLAYHIIISGGGQGLQYSKVVSFGNASDLGAHDFLRYLSEDDKTEIIGAYLEGLKDGRSFFELARKITIKKPLVVWKGGQTDGGSRATLSHTSAIAGSQKIWNAMCRQAGIIAVDTMEELIFTIKALQSLPIPKSTNVAVLGGAGGGSVTMTDFAEKEGLKVPHLADETIEKMGEFVRMEGNSAKNPLDILPAIAPTGEDKENLLRVAKLLSRDPNIDAMIFNTNAAWIYESFGRATLYRYLELSVEAARLLEKPMFISFTREDDLKRELIQREVKAWYNDAGFPTFPDFSLAARVMNNMKRYGDYISAKKMPGD